MSRPAPLLAAFLIALAAPTGGCGSGAGGEPALTVFLSTPLSGSRAADGRDTADGARLALADAGAEAGGVAIGLEVRDDASARGWSAAATGVNARAATEDSTAIAYVGELDSGASRTSVPITNQAGMLQVSPGAGAEDLTRDAPGSSAVPVVQASGERTFGRVIPGDRDQGEAAAIWMGAGGIDSVTVADDGSAFADVLVDGFEAAPDPPSIVPAGDRAEAIYVAAAGWLEPSGAEVGERAVYGSDAQLRYGSRLASGSRPVRLTAAALDPSQLPAAADGFLAAFAEAYGREPGPYAAYGYEAMAAVLISIDRADDPTDRGDVVDAFFAISDRDSILGTYSIDGVGDTTLGRLGAYEVERQGKPRPTPEPLGLP